MHLPECNKRIMRSTFSLLLYINRNKVRVDGTTSVLCQISIDGKSTTITTGISCNPKQWNHNHQREWEYTHSYDYHLDVCLRDCRFIRRILR